jgi:hypothetical protein
VARGSWDSWRKHVQEGKHPLNTRGVHNIGLMGHAGKGAVRQSLYIVTHWSQTLLEHLNSTCTAGAYAAPTVHLTAGMY